MRNLYKKIPLVLLSALTFPILADKKKAEKEETRDEPTYHHKLVLSYEIGQKEKGKGQKKSGKLKREQKRKKKVSLKIHKVGSVSHAVSLLRRVGGY